MKEVGVEATRPRMTKVVWRKLSVSDIDSLIQVAGQIHPNLSESDQVFAERVTLYPEGCLALVKDDDKELCGYAISHPISHRNPPALNNLLGEISPDADQYYIHDLAILPSFRGCGLAQECVEKLLIIAKQYPTTSLISVYGTGPFWGRFGFQSEPIDRYLQKKMVDYGGDAAYLERKNEDYEQLTTNANSE